MHTGVPTASWVDSLARLRPRERGRSSSRPRADAAPPHGDAAAPRGTGGGQSSTSTTPQQLGVSRPRGVSREQACAITGAKRAKKKCCRSAPRCKGCPVVLMRAARAAESGLTGKDLAKAVKRARAA